MPNRPHTTRLAPSPTGALHLGNAYAFLACWAAARANGWRVILRIEDLDGPRVKWGSAEGIIDTLTWLGMDWDEGPHYQTTDLGVYRDAMTRLARAGMAYPSTLSRGEIDDALGAPQQGSGESTFPASLRPSDWNTPREFTDTGENWRFATPPAEVVFDDLIAGPQRITPAQTIGDFVAWTRRGVPAYQLAVVVDDARQGVDTVVRGDDLIDSAARQQLLYHALQLGPVPQYAHLPLVVGPDGRRLAKRHGDTRVDYYRAQGVAAERITGLAAHWLGATLTPEPISSATLVSLIDLTKAGRVPRHTFTPQDDAWLRSTR